MTITDLTGTTWKVNSSLTAISGITDGIMVDIIVTYVMYSGTIDTHNFDCIYNGISGRRALSFNSYSPPEDWISDIGDLYIVDSIAGKVDTITISGGRDTADARLIDWLDSNATLVVEEPEVPTAEGVKEKLQSLITASNAKTGKSDANLTDAVKTLLEGYGQGGGGECSGKHIIEVDELPTENIDENALYKYAGMYYKYGVVIDNIILSLGGGLNLPFLDEAEVPVTIDVIPTKTTENIKETDMEGDGSQGIAFYYIEDENNLFVYVKDVGWVTFAQLVDMEELPFGGFIADESEIIDAGIYIVGVNGWSAYRSVRGVVTVEANGEYDISDFEKVKVDVPNNTVYGKWDLWHYNTIESSHDVNFTTFWNGKLVKCVRMRYVSGIGSTHLWYTKEDGSEIDANSTGQWYGGDWGDDGKYADTDVTRYVDFGTEPQIVSSKFMEFIADCHQISNVINDVQTPEEMDMILENADVGTIVKYDGVTGDSYTNGFLYVVQQEDSNLITFTIEGTTYQAEEGMTYAQWVDSKYNTGGFYTDGTFLYDENRAKYGTVPNMTVNNVIKQGDSLAMFGGGAA